MQACRVYASELRLEVPGFTMVLGFNVAQAFRIQALGPLGFGFRLLGSRFLGGSRF